MKRRSLNFNKKTKWFPHELNIQKTERVQQSNELFEILVKSKHTSFRNIITGDQTWLLFKYKSSGKWFLEDEKNARFEKSHNQLPKMILTII